MTVVFVERPEQLVPQTEIEREGGALAPVVLDEEAHRAAGHLDLAGAVLDRRLLWEAEKEVGEVQAATLRADRSAGAVEAGEGVVAARIRFGL